MRALKGRNFFIIGLAALMFISLPFAERVEANASTPPALEVNGDVKHDTSQPLREMPPLQEQLTQHIIPLRPIPHVPVISTTGDPALQTTSFIKAMVANVTAGVGFMGVGQGFTGPSGAFNVNAMPPDTNGAAGTTQYVQWVNTSFAVFDKAGGNATYGPVAGHTLWTGFGGPCETVPDSGDIIAQYDKAANRWVMMQPVFTSPYYLCVAVSTTSDATGTYHRYAFAIPNNYFPDYPKLGVWADAYYVSYNQFNSSNQFVSPAACALNRSNMLAGTAATMQCFNAGSQYGTLLPSDLDGANAPPAGSPDYFMSLGLNSSSLYMWKFHVNWTTPASSTFTGPAIIPVAAFSEACAGGACIPQPGTAPNLDSIGDRLMYRLAYRNFVGAGAHESLVLNHSVTANLATGVTGIRWYEIRSPGTSPVVYQQGTYSPDSSYRWVGSIAMDKFGDIAVGYSVSSSSINPSIAFTGRLSTDPLGTLESENTIIAGTGSQTGDPSAYRWGDYTSMSIDPVDDCTFWYTNQYLQTDGNFNWSTRVASFSFPSCFKITTLSLPGGSFGMSYSQTLTATGGKTPYAWSITSGSLPPSVILNGSTGVISGTPSAVGTFSFTVQVKDANNTVATRTLSITVYSPLSISTSSLPDGTVGTSYSRTLTATGGKTPYAWSITSGSLPGGLNLNSSTGAISGSPTATGTFSFTVQVLDANSQAAAKALSITVYNPLSISTSSLPDGTAGTSYSQTLTAAGGKTPYSWSVSSGSLPGGLTLNSSTGVISGTPSATGTFSFTIQVTDADNSTASQPLSINVHAGLVMISGTPPAYFPSLQNAFNAAVNGNTIDIQAVVLTENPAFNSPVSVVIQGGYDSTFTNITGYTTISGTLTIQNGTVTVNNLTLQ